MFAPKRLGGLGSRVAAAAMTAGTASLAIKPIRAVAGRVLPSPGEGPDAAEREAGFYEILFYGVHPTDRSKDMIAKVTGDRDPGYGSTSKMLAESAVCLAQDELSCGGGMWTPASAMGDTLRERLVAKAGLTFTIERG